MLAVNCWVLSGSVHTVRKRSLEYFFLFFFQAEDGIRDLVRSRGLGDVYKRQAFVPSAPMTSTEVTSAVSSWALMASGPLRGGLDAVSYTHLTLPTTYPV